MMEKLFHHKKKTEDQSHISKTDDQSQVLESAPEQKAAKQSEAEKLKADFKGGEQSFKNYIKEDEELEQEGKEYGGLM